MRKRVLSICFLFVFADLFCQEVINFDDIFWPFEVVREEMKQSNPYRAIQMLTRVDQEFIKDADFYGQALMTAYCFSGENKKKEEAYKVYRTQKPALAKSEVLSENIYPQDAKEFVLRQADKYPVMMVNEAHLYPQHRIFFKSLLKELYDMGYRHLCMEDLIARDYTGLKYPGKTMGYYINEPVMGELVREALRIGYTLHAYDAPAETNRDSVAAENICQLYTSFAPEKEKILVYCGFAHNMESRKNSMAAYFKRISGIDPLTINQTTYYEAEPSSFYEELIAFYTIDKPVVLVTEEGEALQMNRNYCDFNIISPRTDYIKGRPDWLVADQRKEIEIATGFDEGIIEVYYKDEIADPDAIPVERMVLGKDSCSQKRATGVLLVPDGYSFICKYFDLNHSFLFSTEAR